MSPWRRALSTSMLSNCLICGGMPGMPHYDHAYEPIYGGRVKVADAIIVVLMLPFAAVAVLATAFARLVTRVARSAGIYGAQSRG